MSQFFPTGFWTMVAICGMTVFFVFGVDLLFGAKIISSLSRIVNRKYRVDQALVAALEEIKKASDREFDMEHALLRGWGRFVMSGILLFSASLILLNVLPRLK